MSCNSAVEELDKDIPFYHEPVALYDLSGSDGTVFLDSSPLDPALDLTPSGTVTATNHGATISGDSILRTKVPATKISRTVAATNALTIEAWIRFANLTQTGPSRIVSLSQGALTRNFTLGQDFGAYIVRLKTSDNDANGKPEWSLPGTATLNLTHVVFSYDGNARPEITNFYINGELIKGRTDIFSGRFAGHWNLDFEFMLANEVNNPNNVIVDRRWNGDINRVAVYNRALLAEEVREKFNLGCRIYNVCPSVIQ